MFETLQPLPADKILSLMAAFREDPRPGKIDLGVGVYKNADGVTPIMRSVKTAEEQLWQAQTTKSYTGLVGDPAYADAMIDLIFGGAVARDRIAAAATPGGTGAVHKAFELVKMSNPAARIFVSDPTWPNHLSMLKHLGMETVLYRYFDEETRGLDVDGMLTDIATARPGDVVLLHGCCHNPTGANPNPVDWQATLAAVQKTGAVPMIDLAYQGFGDGLEEDAAATRLIASSVPNCLIAASCSKNFGIYRERAGLIMAVTAGGTEQGLTQATLAHLNRQNFSFPPDHGARLVSMILNDDALRRDWAMELEEMRLGMLALRQQLSSELQQRTGSDRFSFVAQHRGMFSRLGLPAEIVTRLREDHAIYMVGDSRLNIAGLNASTVPVLAQAIADTVD
ncbi:MAG: amino acid aminotransferase [Pseudomonadota bacterium]